VWASKHTRTRLTVKASGEHNAGGYSVGIDVGSWATVLHVTLSILCSLGGDTDRSTTISNTSAELSDGSSLVMASETEDVVLTVDGNVFFVANTELLDGGVDILETTLCTHGLGGVVGVATSSVPVTLNGLGVERADHTELLSETVHDVSGQPHVVTSIHTDTWSDLVLPLTGHHLTVDSSNLDTSVQAGTVVSLDEVATESLVSSHTAIVGSLGSGVTTLGPSEGCVVKSKEGVLLLNAEPWLEGLGALEDLVSGSTGGGGEGLSIGLIGIADNEDVVSTSEGVLEDGTSLDDYFRVVARGLSSG